jgi:hypothetical protein
VISAALIVDRNWCVFIGDSRDAGEAVKLDVR